MSLADETAPPSSNTSISSIRKQIHKYVTNTVLLGELLICIVLALGIKYLDILVYDIHMRPIPYQITAAGDVILDFSINHPYKDMTVSTEQNYFFCLVGVVVVISYFSTREKAPYGDFHCASCVLATSFGLSSLVADTTKRYTGRLRPHFYEKCGFDIELLECTEDDKEERLSFPSGHAFLAFSSMTVLSFYLYGKAYGRMRKAGHADWSVRIYTLLALTPMIWAFYVSACIYQDNWHHAADVVGGAVIGFACAFVSYHLWFHPVFSKEAGMPLNYQRYCVLQDGSPIDPQQYSALLADDSESLMSTTSDRF